MSTLFVDNHLMVDQLLRNGLEASYSFVECADYQLTEQFIKTTGIKPSKNVSISVLGHPPGGPIYTRSAQSGEIESILLNIFINYNWNPVTVRWRANGTKNYNLIDTVKDCSELEIFFESLQPELYHIQLYPKSQLPFKLNNLPYNLVVSRLNMDCEVIMDCKSDFSRNEIIQEIDSFISQFNKRSEKSHPNQAALHSWIDVQAAPNKLRLALDLGSTGIIFLKKLLNQLAKMNAFEKVEIG